MDHTTAPKPFYRSLYFQVITAIIIGVLLGHFYPHTGEAMKPLGDGFIKLIKMIIAPIIFCTVVVGIAPEVAMTLVRLGVRIPLTQTALDLEEGLEWLST